MNTRRILAIASLVIVASLIMAPLADAKLSRKPGGGSTPTAPSGK